ncbi:tripartite tricarboxylate transporter substrate-binding protein [Limnohabitans radicicola]|uniref:Tripartite tricarboxylate transporter substrate binding protein BugD n=1 Tax=Limnohabitans radicicola TaxID=2771427 RepID=A0A927FJI5_9BURK|nr:tripartite tricarboxylate transporter substrate binding protein BugD [Limnohabitans radicicola]
MRSKLLCVPAALVMCVSVNAFAQDYPATNKTITFVLPYAAGGPTDKAARDLAQSMSKAMGGHSIVIDNAAGASGSIGANKVAKAAPDGYTLLFTHIAQATLPSFFRNLPYNVEKDFEYLGLVSENPMNLIGRPSLPANNMAELVSWINANKGKINISNAGPGSASHLCGMLFQSTLKVDMTSVPYKGTAPAMTDLIGGQVDLMCDQTTTTIPQIEGKKVKSFAVTTPTRLSSPVLKDMPTMQEAGLKDFTVTIWQGLYAPKGTPAAVLKKLNDALKVAVKDPEFIRKQDAGGASVINDARNDPAGHKAFVMSEVAKWAPIIKAAGVYAD